MDTRTVTDGGGSAVTLTVCGPAIATEDLELIGRATHCDLWSSPALPPLPDEGWRSVLSRLTPPRENALRTLRLRTVNVYPTSPGAWMGPGRLRELLTANADTLESLSLEQVWLPYGEVSPLMETVCARLGSLRELTIAGTDAFWCALGAGACLPAGLERLIFRFQRPVGVPRLGPPGSSAALWAAVSEAAEHGRLRELRLRFAEFVPLGNFYLSRDYVARGRSIPWRSN